MSTAPRSWRQRVSQDPGTVLDGEEPLPGRRCRDAAPGNPHASHGQVVPREGDLLARGHTASAAAAWSSPTGPQQAFTERRLWAWPVASRAGWVTAAVLT